MDLSLATVMRSMAIHRTPTVALPDGFRELNSIEPLLTDVLNYTVSSGIT